MIQLFILLLVLGPMSFAESTKTYKICDNQVAQVFVSPKGTVFDFPTEPEKVILGTKGTFYIEFVKNDLVLSPKVMGAKSNLFVYLFGRRYVFDLSSHASGATVAVIKDCTENQKRKNQNE